MRQTSISIKEPSNFDQKNLRKRMSSLHQVNPRQSIFAHSTQLDIGKKYFQDGSKKSKKSPYRKNRKQNDIVSNSDLNESQLHLNPDESISSLFQQTNQHNKKDAKEPNFIIRQRNASHHQLFKKKTRFNRQNEKEKKLRKFKTELEVPKKSKAADLLNKKTLRRLVYLILLTNTTISMFDNELYSVQSHGIETDTKFLRKLIVSNSTGKLKEI